MKSEELFYNIDPETDELTGLYTMQTFVRLVREALSSEPDRSFDLLAADMYDFKMTNALYGIEVGDGVLAYAGQRIRQENPYAIGTRVGDKFFFLSPSDRRVSAEKCRQLVDDFRRYPIGGDTIIQFGEYADVDRDISVQAMCDRALLAVSSIKGDYSKRYAAFDEKLRNRKLREHRLAARFENSLETEQFIIYVQPIVSIATGEVVMGEALVRWMDEDGTMIFPGDFIPVFERDGHIHRLDEYMFRKVCRYQRRRIEENKRTVPVSVNLSRGTLFRKDMSDTYRTIIDESGIDAGLVPLEVTESYTIGDRHIEEVLDSFVKKGFTMEMDDFGAGYASLEGLSALPISILKIDKSLNDRIGTPKGNVVVKHAVQMAHELGMEVIAEGIEREEQIDYLRAIGCEAGQGYIYSRPEPLDLFDEMINRKN